MSALTLDLGVLGFSKQNLYDAVRTASRGGSARPATQVRYLADYLAHPACSTATIVVEKPYVDRHYIEEYSRYYATSLLAPPPHATRLHFFAQRYARADLLRMLKSAAEGDDAYARIREQLQSVYLGFCVVRPIPSAPIGRTVLRPYRDQSARVFLTTHHHRVHLCGVELKVEGVPFQQQELAVGACATTAIWSALAVTARSTGRRPPTPFEVTDAATRHVLNDRPFPADSGLDLQQALGAVRAHGFAPNTLKPARNPSLFSFAVKTYLRSGFPVVLLLQEAGGYHALTAVGYREETDEESRERGAYFFSDGDRSLHTSGMAYVYVHEDRLGPYARMRWLAADPATAPSVAQPDSGTGEKDMEALRAEEGGVWLAHEPYRDATYGYPNNRMQVYAAIVPLYPKLRLGALGLLKATGDLVPMLRRWNYGVSASVRVDLRFQLSGEYLREILQLGLQPQGRAAELSTKAVLPRYVGLARVLHKDGAFLDAVFDTTDVLREEPPCSRMLALLALAESHSQSVKDFVSAHVPHGVAV